MLNSLVCSLFEEALLRGEFFIKRLSVGGEKEGKKEARGAIGWAPAQTSEQITLWGPSGPLRGVSFLPKETFRPALQCVRTRTALIYLVSWI